MTQNEQNEMRSSIPQFLKGAGPKLRGGAPGLSQWACKECAIL